MQEKRLEVFLAIAMSRTLGKAADMLNITPSTVSRELKALEGEIGMLLVDRQKGVKTVRLTPAGESFLPLALKWQTVRKEIADSYGEQTAHCLNIAGCEVANNNLLPDVFNRLLSHAPPVHLNIVTDPTDMLYEKVESREVDVAFTVHREASRLVETVPIWREEMLLARFDEDEGGFCWNQALPAKDLAPADELYIEWSKEFRIWHDDIWDPTASVPLRLLTAYLVPFMMNRKGQWSIVPSCVQQHFYNMDKKVCFYRLTPTPPPLIFYKLTHRTPKIGALKGLEILDSILKDMKLALTVL